MLKKLIRLNIDDLWLCCGVPAGLFLLIHLVTAGVLLFGKASTSLMLSGTALPIAAGIILAITAMSHVIITFPQAMTFGRTRKNALKLWLGVAGFEGVCGMAAAVILTIAERLAAPGLWLLLSGKSTLVWGIGGQAVPEPGPGAAISPASDALLVERFVLDWWWFPTILAAALGLGLILGAVIQRFGRKGVWGLWAIWMLVCFAPQILPWDRYEITNWLFPLAGLLAAASLIWSLWSLLHAVVKN